MLILWPQWKVLTKFRSKETYRNYIILEKPNYIIVEFWPLMTLDNISFKHELVALIGFIPSYGIF